MIHLRPALLQADLHWSRFLFQVIRGELNSPEAGLAFNPEFESGALTVRQNPEAADPLIRSHCERAAGFVHRGGASATVLQWLSCSRLSLRQRLQASIVFFDVDLS